MESQSEVLNLGPYKVQFFILGFHGSRCEVNIDDCSSSLCVNGGKCVDGVNSYTCECPPEWSGKYCEVDVDECSGSQNQCLNGATCANEEGGYKCICVNGYEGENCENNVDDCASK